MAPPCANAWVPRPREVFLQNAGQARCRAGTAAMGVDARDEVLAAAADHHRSCSWK